MPTSARRIFTPRQTELLHLMVEEGLDDIECGKALGITRGAIKQMRRNMFIRMERFLGWNWAPRKTDLALFAVTHNLVDMRTVIDRYSPVPREKA